MKYLKIIRLVLAILVVAGFMVSCSKMDSSYKEFREMGLRSYSANPDTIIIRSGENRVELSWGMETAPHVVKYVVYWNAGQDSVSGLISDIMDKDTARLFIDSLTDGIYDFNIYTYDRANNQSIGKSISATVYGSDYLSGLSNRLLQGISVIGSDLKLLWYPITSSNIKTKIEFTNQSDEQKVVIVSPKEMSSLLSNWKTDTKFYWQSTFVPTQNSLDQFTVPYLDSATIGFKKDVEVNKQLWTDARTAYDAPDGKVSDGLKWLWDGKPAKYPEVFYAKGDRMPNSFTIDLGKVYDQLTEIEEWGRLGYSKTNPEKFEVWGIKDTVNALVNKYPDDPDWADSMQSKGWTLLTTVKRDDDGESGWKENLMSGPPPVRYVTIRVLSHIGSGDNRTQLSEITFWCNQFTLVQ